ncbi:MAG TPA: 3-oxoacyl-[acyl-carrier-protein] synthase III C-terminal domain-containing protein [Casimicrobiaceae bacterium]|nr:3-oxoacyl-[acyl-carrier-protein] synthase III C-terminal domain-containing protein [Casimicrobiaceae bacterium]
MFVNGLGTANPPNHYTKGECWDSFKRSDWFRKLDRRSHMIAETVLTKDNGIEMRTLALDELDEVFQIDPDTLHQRFLTHAPALATESARAAMTDARLLARDIDAIVISTCTGYLCPGLSSYVIERLGLRSDVMAFDLVGQGCAAALPNWRLAAALLSGGMCRHVLAVCVEVSSAAMYLDDDPGVLISACLFGDGAGAAVLSPHPDPGRRSIEWRAFGSLTNPAQRDALKFETQHGMLRNILTRDVPRLAADHAQQVLQRVLDAAGLTPNDIAAWIMHAGGRDVLLALQRTLQLDNGELRYSAAVLRDYGNMSSAFVYYVLQAALRDNAPSGWWWMSSFGAGFSCHGALLKAA